MKLRKPKRLTKDMSDEVILEELRWRSSREPALGENYPIWKLKALRREWNMTEEEKAERQRIIDKDQAEFDRLTGADKDFI